MTGDEIMAEALDAVRELYPPGVRARAWIADWQAEDGTRELEGEVISVYAAAGNVLLRLRCEGYTGDLFVFASNMLGVTEPVAAWAEPGLEEGLADDEPR